MKYKTSELSGARLDQAVAKACGYLYDKNISEDFIVTTLDPSIPPRPPEHVHREVCRVVIDGQERPFCPSSEWVHGGPIIERNHISVECYQDTAGRSNMRDVFWLATLPGGTCLGFERDGAGEAETVLVAAMRCFVHARMGEEVDL